MQAVAEVVAGREDGERERERERKRVFGEGGETVCVCRGEREKFEGFRVRVFGKRKERKIK